jgi:hypothetical protein
VAVIAATHRADATSNIDEQIECSQAPPHDVNTGGIATATQCWIALRNRILGTHRVAMLSACRRDRLFLQHENAYIVTDSDMQQIAAL